MCRVENAHDESHLPLNNNLRQQLEEMFKHRASRYNFLDQLDDTLTGNQRLMHVKDRLRQCQAVFLNLKMALTKIEKQRILFLRRQQHPSGTRAVHRHRS